jgi:hypothetical protein
LHRVGIEFGGLRGGQFLGHRYPGSGHVDGGRCGKYGEHVSAHCPYVLGAGMQVGVWQFRPWVLDDSESIDPAVTAPVP